MSKEPWAMRTSSLLITYGIASLLAIACFVVAVTLQSAALAASLLALAALVGVGVPALAIRSINRLT